MVVGAQNAALTSTDLIVATDTNSVGNYAGSTATGCTAGNVTTNTAVSAAGVVTNTCTAIGTAGGVTGTGTANSLAKWTSTTAQGNSTSTDDGTTTHIGSTNYAITDATGAGTIAGLQTLNGGLTTAGSTVGATFGKITGVHQTTTATGTQDNFNIGSGALILAWNGSANVTFDGFACGGSACSPSNDGQLLYVTAYSSFSMTFAFEAAGSTAANQLLTLGATKSVVQSQGGGILFQYDGVTNNKWIQISWASTRIDSPFTFVGTVAMDSAATVNGLLNVGVTATNAVLAANATSGQSVNHGTLSADASAMMGSITSIGSFTSVTLTLGGGGFTTAAHCWTQITSAPATGSVADVIYVSTVSKSAPVFSCQDATAGGECRELPKLRLFLLRALKRVADPTVTTRQGQPWLHQNAPSG